MRYIVLIAFIDFLFIGFLNYIVFGMPHAGGALLYAAFISMFGIPIGIIVGIPGLWLSRRIAPGSVVPLLIIGALFGLLAGTIAGGIAPLQTWMLLMGGSVGLLSAILWWVLVERYPDRRERYD